MKKILILYSTFTGNTEEAAKTLYQKLSSQNPHLTFTLSNVRDIAVTNISGYHLVIFGTSTWEDNNSPDTEKFLHVLQSNSPDFSNIPFGLFGLGDSAYLNFCAAVPLVQQELKLRNANIYPKIFTIDGYPTTEALSSLIDWAMEFISQYSHPLPMKQ